MRSNPISLAGIALLGAVQAQSYDYIIVGAGTGGLLIANRLSANPDITVAVIDPGSDQRNNPNVTDPTQWQNSRTTPINWNYTTVPQTSLSGRVIELEAGNGIGGTSLINGIKRFHMRNDGLLELTNTYRNDIYPR